MWDFAIIIIASFSSLLLIYSVFRECLSDCPSNFRWDNLSLSPFQNILIRLRCVSMCMCVRFQPNRRDFILWKSLWFFALVLLSLPVCVWVVAAVVVAFVYAAVVFPIFLQIEKFALNGFWLPTCWRFERSNYMLLAMLNFSFCHYYLFFLCLPVRACLFTLPFFGRPTVFFLSVSGCAHFSICLHGKHNMIKQTFRFCCVRFASYLWLL